MSRNDLRPPGPSSEAERLERTALLLNLMGAAAAALVLAFAGWVTRDSVAELPGQALGNSFSLAVMLLVLPDLLRRYLLPRAGWWACREALGLYLLLVTGGLGLALGGYPSFWIPLLLWPLSAGLLLWNLVQFWRDRAGAALVCGLCLVSLFFLYFYSTGRGYETPLIMERILLGDTHLDPLFFSSIAAMISSYGISSTGLDGLPYYPYHWGTYALFGGLKNLVGINSLLFHNVVYPALLIGLYLKGLFLFTHRYFRYRGVRFWLLAALSLACVLYSLPLLGFLNGRPVGSSSHGLAILCSFILFSGLLAFAQERRPVSPALLIWVFLMLLAISFTKISTGFVVAAAMCWLGYRTVKPRRERLLAGLLALVLAGLVYGYAFPEARTTYELGLLKRYVRFWRDSDSFLTYTLGLWLVLLALPRRLGQGAAGWRGLFQSRGAIDLELLLVITLTGLLGGAMVSQWAPDVRFFCTNQLYLGLPLLFLMVQRVWEGLPVRRVWTGGALLVAGGLSLVARPDLLSSARGVMGQPLLKERLAEAQPEQQRLRDFLRFAQSVHGVYDPRRTCLYIPPTESWYYDSQKAFPPAALFVGPAITGLAMVQGIPEALLDGDTNYFSLYYYKGQDRSRSFDLAGARARARKLGFRQMIRVWAEGGQLRQEVLEL